MEKIIQEAMNDQVVKEAGVQYGIPFEDIKRLGGFENFIYEYKQKEKEYILRFVHSVHRSFELVFAELEFIDYLAHNGANVSTVVKTNKNELLFKILLPDGNYFSVCAFTKAPGTYVKREDLNDAFYEDFGKAVGKLHRLTKSYTPKHKRTHFFEEDYIDLGIKYCVEEDQFVIDRAIEITEKLKNFDRDVDSYGLIHTDLHFGNMYYDGKQLTFFDFDDASYKHFISDIAIIIFYSFGIGKLTDKEIEDKTIELLVPFMKGYEKENKLDIKWMYLLNDFFMLRQVILYMVIYAAGEEMVNGPWGKQFLDKYRLRIKNNTPFFNVERVIKAVWNL